jgi:DNA replication protein DnaC
MLLARIPDRYWGALVRDFGDEYEGLDPIELFTDRLSVNIRDGVGLLVFGPPGHGKTHLSCALLKKVMGLNGSAMYLEASEVQEATIERRELDEYSIPLMDRASKVDLLALDDVGAEHVSAFSRTLVERLVRKRIARNKAIVVTSNKLPLDLAGIYGRGFHSVITEALFPVAWKGTNWRDKRKDDLKRRFERGGR